MVIDIFAKRLTELRESKNMSQQELAEILGITRQSVSLYEKAERTINVELLAQIAKYFDVSTDYLLGLSDVSSVDVEDKAICERIGISERTFQAFFYFFEKPVPSIDPDLTTEEMLFDSNVMQSFICGLVASLEPYERLGYKKDECVPLFCRMLSLYVYYKELFDDKSKEVDKSKELVNQFSKACESGQTIDWEEYGHAVQVESKLMQEYSDLEDKCNAAEYRLNKSFIALLDYVMQEWYGYFKQFGTQEEADD